MPGRKTIQRAEDKRKSKSPSTQVREFIKAEIEKIRKAIAAIGSSEAKRAGVKPPAKGKTSGMTRKSATRNLQKGKRHEPVSLSRSRARIKALKKEPTTSASHAALTRQTRSAKQRTSSEHSAAARSATRTKKHRSSVRGEKIPTRKYGKSLQYNPG